MLKNINHVYPNVCDASVAVDVYFLVRLITPIYYNSHKSTFSTRQKLVHVLGVVQATIAISLFHPNLKYQKILKLAIQPSKNSTRTPA